MSALSAGWDRLRLGDIAVKTLNVNPARFPREQFELYSVPSFESSKPDQVFGKEIKSAKQVVEPDDVLLCKIVPHLNRVWIVAAKSRCRQIASGEWIVYRNRQFDPHYLQYLLSEASFRDKFMATVAGVGGSLMRARPSEVAEIEIPIAPLSEQRRIVAKIDSLFAKSRRARENLSHIPRLVQKYKQAVLTAAFQGRLTVDSRAINFGKTGSRWSKQSLIQICDQLRPITYGVIKLGSETPNGTPCLRTSNVRWLRVDTGGMKKISPKLSSEYSRTILRGGEVLVNVRGTLGGVAVATQSMKDWNVSREVAVVPVDTTVVEPHYLAYWIGSNASQRWLNRVEKGVAYTGINIEDLRKLPIEFPPIDEQREIIRLIETAFAWISRLDSETASARRLIAYLDQTILAKAFLGELVSQNPNDEPASALLERVEAERQRTLTPHNRSEIAIAAKRTVKSKSVRQRRRA